jgi:putative peptidoglycan lipid II flippase
MDARTELDAFKRTFSRGLRLVVVLILPATALLAVLGRTMLAAGYEHGAFSPADTLATWRALRLYLIGLPFAAIDLPLIFSFYAQKDTVTPVVVGIVAVAIYLVVGPTLTFVFGWGFLGLVMANSVQLLSHAAIMLVLFRRRYGSLSEFGVGTATARSLLASAPAAGAAWVSLQLLRPYAPTGFAGEAFLIVVCSLLGVAAYLATARLLRMEELGQLASAMRLRRRA